MTARTIVLCLVLLASTPVLAGSTEMVDGDQACSYGPESAWHGITLNSSGDLFPLGKFGWREFEGAGAVGEAFCGGQLEGARRVLASFGCVVTDPETTAYEEEGVTEQRIFFVCEGPRRQMVKLGAALFAGFIAASP